MSVDVVSLCGRISSILYLKRFNPQKIQEDDMKKVARSVIFILGLLLVSGGAYGASNKCRVVEVEEKKLVLECERDTSQFEVGDQVKIKSMRKSAAVEGC